MGLSNEREDGLSRDFKLNNSWTEPIITELLLEIYGLHNNVGCWGCRCCCCCLFYEKLLSCCCSLICLFTFLILLYLTAVKAKCGRALFPTFPWKVVRLICYFRYFLFILWVGYLCVAPAPAAVQHRRPVLSPFCRHICYLISFIFLLLLSFFFLLLLLCLRVIVIARRRTAPMLR